VYLSYKTHKTPLLADLYRKQNSFSNIQYSDLVARFLELDIAP
jgi:hypothetical protein